MILTNKSKLTPIIVLSLILVLSFALSATAEYRWEGNVTIGTNTSTTGAIVGGYWGAVASPNQTFTVGAGGGVPSNGYVITLPCDSGNTRFLKVWGINSTVVTCNQGPATGNSTNLSVSLLGSGVACTYSQACDSNYDCCSGGSEVPGGSTAGTCAASCAVEVQQSGSGGGSSGGGGGGTTFGSESSILVTISGATTRSLAFTKSATIAVTNVQLFTTASAAITNGKVSIRETVVGTEMSSGIAAGATKVFKYLSITKTNMVSSDIDKAVIQFEVTAAWLNANNIDPNSVKLNRYVNSQWVALPTTRLKAVNSRGYLYEAETSGFSIFAISGKEVDKLTAFQLIDRIRDFYAGTSAYTAFDIIDQVRKFYA